MTPLIWIVIFIVSIIVLVKASDFFTDAAEHVGLYFGMSKFIIGVTIVAIGTSLPELMTSIIAVISGNSEIVVGNVVGSNITNIFLVLAVVAIIAKKISVKYDIISIDMPFLMGSALLLVLTLMDGQFTLPEAILFILATALYLFYGTYSEEAKKNKKKKIKKQKSVDSSKKEVKKEKLGWAPILTLIFSVIFIYIGAKFTVDSVVELSKLFQIGTEIIAVTVVALGTSLPELAVSISAARKGRTEMAIGNVLGSNIFNSFGVMGIAALFGTIVVPKEMLTLGLPVMVIATLMYFFITLDRKTTKWEGWLLILFYLFFLGYSLGAI